MYKMISALTLALALSSLTLPSLAQEASAVAGNGGNGERVWPNADLHQQAANRPSPNQEQQQLQNQTKGANTVNQVGQQETPMERWQRARLSQEEMHQGLNPSLIGEMRARMRQAGEIGIYQSRWTMTPQTASPDNADPAYSRGRLRPFAQLMQQHAVEARPYETGGNQ